MMGKRLKQAIREMIEEGQTRLGNHTIGLSDELQQFLQTQGMDKSDFLTEVSTVTKDVSELTWKDVEQALENTEMIEVYENSFVALGLTPAEAREVILKVEDHAPEGIADWVPLHYIVYVMLIFVEYHLEQGCDYATLCVELERYFKRRRGSNDAT